MITERDLIRAFVRGAKWTVGYSEANRIGSGIPSRAEVENAAEVYAALVVRELSALVPPATPVKKTGRKAKEEKPAGWSDAAWERCLAARGANSYAALNNETLSRRVMNALDKKEELRPPSSFRARFSYGSTLPVNGSCGMRNPGPANAALVGLVMLGVAAELVHVETEEEHARRELLDSYAGAKITARVTLGGRTGGKPDPHLSGLFRARTVAVELLEAGMRWEARDLLKIVRESERAILKHFGTLEPTFGEDRFGNKNTRAGHRRMRAIRRVNDAALLSGGSGE